MKFENLIFANNNIIEKFSDDLKKFAKKKEVFLYDKVVKELNLFCEAFGIVLNINAHGSELLIITFWRSALIYYKHHCNGTGWSDSSKYEYLNVIRKILEVIVYSIHVKVKEIDELYLNDEIIKFEHYYFYLQNNLKIQDAFKIIEGKYHNNKSVRNFILLYDPNTGKTNQENKKITQEYIFHSVNNHPVMSPQKEDNHLMQFFKLQENDENVVWRIFNLSFSKGKNETKSRGGFRGKSFPLEIYEIVNYIKPNLIKEEIEAKETEQELELLTQNTIVSPLLDENNAKLVNRDFWEITKKNKIEANYKKLLIQKAVTNTYIMLNVDLRTIYNKPSLPLYRKFLHFIINNSNQIFFNNLIILSSVLGIQLEKLIYVILDLDVTIKYKKRTKGLSKLFFQVNKENFGDFVEMTNSNIGYSTLNEGEIDLVNSFEKRWLDLKTSLEEYIAENISHDDIYIMMTKTSDQDTSTIDKDSLYAYVEKFKELRGHEKIKKYSEKNFSKEFLHQISQTKFVEHYINKLLVMLTKDFNNYKKKFNKTVNLNFSNLHTLFFFYFKTYEYTSDIPLLFTQNISKNNQARQTYCNSIKKLIRYEKWVYNFTQHLGLNEYFENEPSNHKFLNIDHEYRIGSNNLVKPYQFKNFLLSLNRLVCKNEIMQLNILMIYLRYAFSILLVSRDIMKSSANLSQVSTRFNIITIQEKGKNVYQGKRIIPLTKRAVKYIQVFKSIKEKYHLESNSPVLVAYDKNLLIETSISMKNVNKYLTELFTEEKNSIEQNELKISISDILQFTKYVKINFGRHIITSEMVQRGVQSNYIDAVMGHFQLGKEDQGKFSSLDNQQYILQIREIMEDIEHEYFPNSLDIKDLLWK